MYRRPTSFISILTASIMEALKAMAAVQNVPRFRGYTGAVKPNHTRVKGKTYPQHGKQECARRLRQLEVR